MTAASDPTATEALWRTIFQDGHPFLMKKHRLHRLLPRPPRCRLCLAPFAGPGGWLMRRRGQTPSPRNPNYCNACNAFLDANPGGAEVEMPVLFVDVRGSTAAAAAEAPTSFAARINRFFDRVTAVLAEGDGFVVEFRGDCVAAVFPPGFVGPGAAGKAVAAARALRALRSGDDGFGFGIGVHHGRLYIGTVGAAVGRVESVTVFGDSANLAAAVAQAAPAGTAFATGAAARAAGLAEGGGQVLALKGRDEPVPVVQL
jgi:adenylate cyclase